MNRSRRAALVLALAAACTLGSAASSQAVTQFIHFQPFLPDGTLAPGLTASKQLTGDCVGSLADPRSDTWRCFPPGGEFIQDPCFVSPTDPSYMVCAAAPWDPNLVGLRSSLDPSKHVSPGGHIWAVQLTHGNQCGWLSGGTTVFHHKRLNFGCQNRLALFGTPRTSTTDWTILSAKKARPKRLRPLTIAIAWS